MKTDTPLADKAQTGKSQFVEKEDLLCLGILL